jgi:DNA-binding transcriptional MerR regulator
MADVQYKSPQEVAARLDVPSSTLHEWSDEFLDFLSDSASSQPEARRRQYSDQDITRLLIVKDYMTDGLTYEEVRQRLGEQLGKPKSNALVTGDMGTGAVMDYFSDTIDNLRQGQLSVLNSQAANRELMGVVIQDNFNLKEENNRLRNRMLELERQLGQVRRDDEMRTESLRREFEMKLFEIREMVSRQPITILQSRSGCLGGLFGGGTQVASKAQDGSRPYGGQSYQNQPPRGYPKPPGPPE